MARRIPLGRESVSKEVFERIASSGSIGPIHTKKSEFSFRNGEPDFEAVCEQWEGVKQQQKLSERSKYAGNQLQSPKIEERVPDVKNENAGGGP